MPSRFAAAGEPGCFAYRKAARAAEPGGLEFASTTIATPMPEPEREPMAMPPIASQVPASPPADAPATPVAVIRASLLEQAAELANRGDYAEAVAACERHLRLKGPGCRRIT